MSDSSSDDQRLDDDHTAELPVLLESVVLDSEDPRLAAAENLDQTGEHTARYAALAPTESADVEGLTSDLAARDAKIEALQTNIATLSARWADNERDLTTKDLLIEDLQQTLTKLRESLAERSAAEQRLTTEITDRDAQLGRVLEELEGQRRATAERAAKIKQLQDTAHAAGQEAAALREQVTTLTAAGRDANQLQMMREEIATLAGYIANRRAWWDELEARARASAARVDDLERELADRRKQQRRAEALAERETARARALRADLIAQARLVETLRRGLAAARATNDEPPPAAAGLLTELAAARTAAAQAAAALVAEREAFAAALAERDARDTEQAGARAATERERPGARSLPGDAAAPPPPPPAFEVIAQLEAEVEHKRQQVSAQLVELRERDHRLATAEQRLASSRLDLGTARAELEQARADSARLERALIDKDRALEARDARIATLQEELDQRVGALQELDAMDVSLQGLDSKVSERLRRTESPAADRINTPALVCLTGEAPRQIALTKKAIVIGRSPECDVQILTHFISREHARITVNRGSAVIEDLGSTNGVFVNSVRVDRQELRQGDLITLGETQFRFLESMAH